MLGVPFKQTSESSGCEVNKGVGLTVTVNSFTNPSHSFVFGVTVYTTIPGVFLVLINCSEGMLVPSPLLIKPLIPSLAVAVQEKEVFDMLEANTISAVL